jgi:serine/threonine protein kinase/formylglycine-generating enzyme required for sulfatase activity
MREREYAASDAPTMATAAVLNEFLQRFLADRESGGVQPLAAYQARWPGFEAAIADEYRRLTEDRMNRSSQGPPSWLGPFRLVRLLGKGGQGAVYLAEDTRLSRTVALKVLSLTAPLASTADATERFKREAYLASRLDHPGICTVYEAGILDGISFISMRFVKGESLARRIEVARAAPAIHALSKLLAVDGASERNEGSIDGAAASVLEFFERAARALHVAHEAGIVHRDLKPGNIMVTTEGEPVILDFGLARLAEGDDGGPTRTGDLLGTPAYLAPEQIRGRPLEIDRRTDVWALGASLFQALTLRLPFEATTRDALYHAILTEDPPRLRRLSPVATRDLEVILDTALEKNPDRRYDTALAFAEDLRRVRQHETISARPASVALRLWRWIERNPVLTFILALLAALLIVSLVLLKRTIDAKNEVAVEADLYELRVLHDWEQELWPAVPATVAGPRGMDAWLVRAEALDQRFGKYSDRLKALELRAEAWNAEDQAADRVFQASQNDLQNMSHEIRLRQLRLERASRPHGPDDPDVARRKTEIVELEQQLERQLRVQKTWRFSDPADARWHDRLTQIGREARQSLPIDAVRKRRAFALSVGPRTLALAEWKTTAQEVANDPRYGGLCLQPQLGLVPIGRDPESRLFEFVHVQTGAVPARDPATGKIAFGGGTGIVFVLLPGGVFQMGAQKTDPSSANYDSSADAASLGPHEVALDPFFISKYEMTQGQWKRVAEANPSDDAAKDAEDPEMHPVEHVRWQEANRWMLRLGLRLPTEAQWEYACRAGTRTRYSTGKEAETLLGRANLKGGADRWEKHAPVGKFPPNAFGLHDVHGNVAEWCLDGRGSYADPPEHGNGFHYVSGDSWQRAHRGGSFVSDVADVGSGRRSSQSPVNQFSVIGLRPARSLQR